MGKAKFSVSNAFRGRRRRSCNQSSVKIALETTTKVIGPQDDGPSTTCYDIDTTTATTSSTSASSRKLDFFGVSIDVSQRKGNSSEDCFFIVQQNSLNKLVAALNCPKCSSSGLKFVVTDSKMSGFAIKGAVICEVCQETVCEQYMCERVDNSSSSRAPFEVNTRAVIAFRGIGCGQSAMQRWCGTMNMPNCLSSPAYQNIQTKLNVATKETFGEVSKTTHEAIVKSYEEVGIKPDSEGILEIGVSFDGSWHKRGHSSHTGIGIAIDLLTGLPIDYEVLSNYCLKCQLAPSKDDENFDEWLQNHSEKCSKNYEGSANSMEMECAKRIWERSEEKHKLRYTTILSDGDSKTYDNLVQNKVYVET